MQWYYVENGQQTGPVSEEEWASLIAAGKVSGATLVWREGMDEWQPYNVVQGVGTSAAGEDRLACSQCGRVFPPDELIQYETALVCAECKPSFFQRVQEGAPLPGTVAYAGFWIRFLAKFVDGLILGAVNMAISMAGGAMIMGLARTHRADAGVVVIQVLLWFLQMAIAITYSTFFLGRFQATPGKMALRLKVIRSDGSPVTYGRAFGRYFAEILSSLILYIGYIMAAFDEEKRALHDRICDTRVIKAG